MTIPNRPLELNNFSFGELTLADDRLLQSPGAYANDLALGQATAEFLARYSNWTRAEIDAIQNKELLEIYRQVVEAINAQIFPLAKSPPSRTGRGKRRRASPAGSTS